MTNKSYSIQSKFFKNLRIINYFIKEKIELTLKTYILKYSIILHKILFIETKKFTENRFIGFTHIFLIVILTTKITFLVHSLDTIHQ